MTKRFGYVRVSSKDQNLARQKESMLELGIEERDIFEDKQSGKNFDRQDYQALKRVLREGDILYIHSLDRLGRDKEMILEEWNEITKKIKAHIVVLDMPLLDTTKDNTGVNGFVADLVLQILSWIAQDERERIKKRQREGIDVAMKNGVRFGRPTVGYPDNFEKVYNIWKAGDITAKKAMEETGLTRATFYRLVKKYEAE